MHKRLERMKEYAKKGWGEEEYAKMAGRGWKEYAKKAGGRKAYAKKAGGDGELFKNGWGQGEEEICKNGWGRRKEEA